MIESLLRKVSEFDCETDAFSLFERDRATGNSKSLHAHGLLFIHNDEFGETLGGDKSSFSADGMRNVESLEFFTAATSHNFLRKKEKEK